MPSPLVPTLPDGLHKADDFVASVKPSDLVYFLLNVGDGDTQLILLPADAETGRRQAIVVDVYRAGKLESLLAHLATPPLFSLDVADREFPLAIVVGTHPHADHIAGMPAFLARFHAHIGEYWDSGYFHTSDGFHNTMDALERHRLDVVQPTSGQSRFIGQVKLTVLAPAIGLKNRFETYGIEINNSSIALRLEVPASRVVVRGDNRELVRQNAQSLILGADAQTASWGHAMADFPELRPHESSVAKAMDRAQGHYPLKADVFKVPHHGSKHGLNLEVVELMKPKLSLLSSVVGEGKFNFPHLLCLEALREAANPIASQVNGKHDPDYELGIHLTGEEDGRGVLGSMALVVSSTSSTRTLWRFRDDVADDIDFADAWKLKDTP